MKKGWLVLGLVLAGCSQQHPVPPNKDVGKLTRIKAIGHNQLSCEYTYKDGTLNINVDGRECPPTRQFNH